AEGRAVKQIAFCLCLLPLAGAGCFAPPKGSQNGLPKPPQAELTEPPAPVMPDDVTESNARDAVKRLEQEIKFDERPAPPPEAAPPPAEKKPEKKPEESDNPDKPEKPKRSGRPWGPTWG